MTSTPSSPSSAMIIDPVLHTVAQAYSQALGCTPTDVADDGLLTWCLNEIQETFDSDDRDPRSAYVSAIQAMNHALQDLQTIVNTLEDQLQSIASSGGRPHQ